MVHPARFELATNWFEASYSNPLSYGCSLKRRLLVCGPMGCFASVFFVFSLMFLPANSRYNLLGGSNSTKAKFIITETKRVY